MADFRKNHPHFTSIIHRLIASGSTGKDSYRFYGEFAAFINFIEDNSPSMPTAGVWIDTYMNMAYNRKFVLDQTEQQATFLLFHEIFHLLYKHPSRTKGRFDHRLANIAQDMIINTSIIEDIPKSLVDIPRFERTKKDGSKYWAQDCHMEIPPEYKDERIFEVLYMWLLEQKKKVDQIKKENRKSQKRIKQENEEKGATPPPEKQENEDGEGSSGEQEQENSSGQQEQENDSNDGTQDCDSQGNDQSDQDSDSQGSGSGGQDQESNQDPQGNGSGDWKDPHSEDKDPYDGMSEELKRALETHANKNEVIFDVHKESNVPDEMREKIVDNAIERLRQRGLVHADIEGTLGKLRKSKKNYLPSLKRGISQVKSKVKVKSFVKPNRRAIKGLKGNKKESYVVNCLLDVSGSMGGCFNKVLSYLFHDNFVINLIQCDTEVTKEQMVTDKKQLQDVRIKGLGGTTLQPGLDLIKEKYSAYNTVILTDGYTDALNVNGCGKTLIITTDSKCPIAPGSRQPRQIVIEDKGN